MARMNREILVPYLQDVCALQLAKKKCQDQIVDLRSDMDDIRKRAILPRPTEREREREPRFGGDGWSGVGCSAVGCAGMVFIPLFFVLAFDNNYDGWMMNLFNILLYGGALLAIGGFFIDRLLTASENKKIEAENRLRLQKWRQQSDTKKAEADAKCAPILKEIGRVEQQISMIDGLLSRAYSANLIPSRYRDLYAAVYLYDWFSTGMSDDMDMALNTYVLEQIKSRLDMIIRNQAEQIINQRTIIANQARSMNMIERNAQQMRAKVSRMNETLEKQNMYLNMIDSNVAATRYFAEQTYKKWN